MTGVSYMIPFVAAGGLLIALSFLFGGYEIVGPVRRHRGQQHDLQPARPAGARPRARACSTPGFFAYIGALFFIIGKTAFALFIPALAGYIAYAIADRPGIAPGFVMGGLAANLFNVDRRRRLGHPGDRLPGRHRRRRARRRASPTGSPRWKVPVWARGLMPVLVIPLLTCDHRRPDR